VATQKSQKSKTTSSRPVRALAGLLAVIIVMLLAIVGSKAFSPGSWKHEFKVQLGLDLSSGTAATLTAQTTNGKPLNSSYMKEAIAIMIARVNGAGFSGAQVQQQGSNNIVVTVPGKNATDVLNLVGQTAQLLFRQVLLVGGPGSTASTATTPTPTPSGLPSTIPSTTPSSSPSSTPSSPNSPANTSSPHAAGLPGSSGPDGAQGLSSGAQLLGAKAHASSSPSSSPHPSTSPSGSTSASPTPTATSTAPASTPAAGNASLVTPSVRKLFDKLDCSNLNKWKSQIGYTTKEYDNPNQQIVSCANPSSGFGVGTKFVLDKAKVLGKEVTGAQAGVASSQQSLSNKWQVNVSLNGAGAAAFATLTSDMFSKYGTAGNNPLDDLAIVLDGVVISAPQIQGAIPGGQAQITYFPQSEAQLLAQQLNYGALPVTLTKQSVVSVSPSLGRDQLNAGLLAAGIGLALVVIYSFIYYRGLGIVSVTSLIIASILAYGTVVLLSKYASSGFSLELSGIAGLIVAIGITADSFVVFFERLRDEVREGKSLRPAVESGWRRARRTILVSDTVSFLAALLLWYFSVSDVKGFAFTLGLTTLIDIVVVFLFTKPMVTLLARTKFFSSGHRMSGLDPVRLGARAPWRSGLPRPATRVTREA
jgi:preprotein translocase subunit SecD